MYSIEILDNEGNTYTKIDLVEERKQIFIGRGAGKTDGKINDIQLPVGSKSGISRNQCSVWCQDDECILQDEGSVYGTLVNGVKVEAMTHIHPGDNIELPSKWKIVLHKTWDESTGRPIATEPPQPIVEPPQPVVEPPQPVVEPSQPVVEQSSIVQPPPVVVEKTEDNPENDVDSLVTLPPLKPSVMQPEKEKSVEPEANTQKGTPQWTGGGENADLLYNAESMKWMKLLHNEILDCFARTDIREIDRYNPEHQAKLEEFLEDVITRHRHEIPGSLPTEDFKNALRNEIIGHGPITELLENEKITEIMVNGPSKIFIEIGGAMYITPYKFFSEESLIAMIRGIVEPLGRRIDPSSPMVDARLEDGSRVNAIIPPLALDGASVTIRKFSKKKLTVDDLIGFGSMDRRMADFLKLAVEKRQNIVVSGGTGSGKTTLLNVLSDFIPSDQRVVTIEDSAELKLNADNIVRLEARQANVEGIGRVTIRDLVINALRMRPDRIVVGECRGAEALDMLQAMNTGHDGSLTTLHANNPRDALSRLENMVMMAGFELPMKAIREQIASAVNLIVHQSRMPGHSRKIVAITEVTRMEEDKILMQDIFTFEQTGLSMENGEIKLEGFFKPTGNIPEFVEAMKQAGENSNEYIPMFVEGYTQYENGKSSAYASNGYDMN